MDFKKNIRDITVNGFTVLNNVLSKTKCEEYKEMLENDFKKYSSLHAKPIENSRHSLDQKTEEKVVYNLHNKNKKWFDLFEHEKILKIMDHTLKPGSYMNNEPYNLLNISARSPLKNNKKQQLHLDSNLPGGDFPLIMVVLWMLDDFNESNGATRLVPGSHKFTSYAENNKSYKNEITVSAEQGSVLIYNASLWHGGGVNQTDKSRWGLVLGYGRWFIKPSFDFTKNTPIEIYNQLNDSQKELLGFKSTPPKDEFTRIKRRSSNSIKPENYILPKI